MSLMCFVLTCDCAAVTVFWGFALCDDHYDKFAAKASIVTSFQELSRLVLELR